ncbi:unnamed protein product [Phytophthora fragariaefolia]|uniref:Unnamed protein product n=1 Tax=Phytophthora fragariaefolia TaxID=1490495 RepID=A0A9W6Y503_9STRA|nr:unnamed protein product [Phytophthora fragariaefolia]
MRLCGLHYTIEHIPGEKNVWADIVSRWHARSVIGVAAVRTRSRQVVPVSDLSPLRPLADDDFAFPTPADILTAQQAAAREKSRLRVPLMTGEDGVVTIDERLWIPTSSTDLVARLFVVAHCGSQGHRGQEAMLLALKERFYIANMDSKVAKFVRQCLLCKHFKGPRQIPRPISPRGKNGLSHFCELFPCATPTAFVAAEALTMWYARYGMPATLLSDQGTHFRNETMKHLAARLKVELSFTPGFSPWLNGTVERLNKDVLQVFRALLMEYGLDQHEWPYLLPAVQANLNHTRFQSLAGHAPIEVCTALPASSALGPIVVPASAGRNECVVDLADFDDMIDQLRASLHDLHREVADAKERQRLRDMAAHNGTPANFDVGDYVLWSRIDQRLPNPPAIGAQV